MKNLVSVVDLKKQKSILSKKLLHIILLLITFSASGQVEKSSGKVNVWKKEKEKLEYTKDKNYKGPSNWGTDNPSSMQREVDSDYDQFKYDPQEIRRNRESRKYRYEDGNGIDEPEIERPVSDERPIERNHQTYSSSNKTLISEGFLKTIGLILLFGLVIYIVYSLIKNRDSFKKEVKSEQVLKEMNPEIISKSELELLLEKYTNEENYRECVRIYFTFILKEIIRNGWINWKKEKTNFDYILEMKGKPNSERFEESVKIYDLVWYGEYGITKEVYHSLQPILLSYYQSLQSPIKSK